MEIDPIVSRFEQAQDRLVLQASDLSLKTIGDMVNSGAIDVDPAFQRRERWGAQQRSALIESFLLNIPVPPIYLAEDAFGQYSVIDGKQRITAIAEYMTGSVPLAHLETFTEIEGLRFDELPPALQNFLTVRPAIRAVSLLRQSDPNLKYEVFHRLNSGGEPLNAQEIRNALFRGPLNDVLNELAGSAFLKEQLKIRSEKSPNYQKMVDVEWVLRFFTLATSIDTFSGDLRSSMDLFMAERRELTGRDIDSLRMQFTRSICACESLWGENAFRRPERGGWRDQALAGMYDAQMIAVSSLTDASIEALNGRREKVDAVTKSLFEDPLFEDAVRTATNTPSKLTYRVSQLREALEGIARV